MHFIISALFFDTREHLRDSKRASSCRTKKNVYVEMLNEFEVIKRVKLFCRFILGVSLNNYSYSPYFLFLAACN